MGSDHVFVVLGVGVRVLTPINSCHFNANFCMTIKDVCFGKSEMFFVVRVEWHLCSHQLFTLTFGHSPGSKELFA